VSQAEQEGDGRSWDGRVQPAELRAMTEHGIPKFLRHGPGQPVNPQALLQEVFMGPESLQAEKAVGELRLQSRGPHCKWKDPQV
jgi:hypothetical protein